MARSESKDAHRERGERKKKEGENIWIFFDKTKVNDAKQTDKKKMSERKPPSIKIAHAKAKKRIRVVVTVKSRRLHARTAAMPAVVTTARRDGAEIDIDQRTVGAPAGTYAITRVAVTGTIDEIEAQARAQLGAAGIPDAIIARTIDEIRARDFARHIEAFMAAPRVDQDQIIAATAPGAARSYLESLRR